MLLLISMFILMFFIIMYNRYIPVKGVQCSRTLNVEESSIKIVDVRNYNQSYKDTIVEAINIPVAYLKRNYHEISSMKIHVVASNHLEKNISIRFLKKRGFKVTGYTLTDC
jgi:rhodanese-related sulfurtransferase